MEIKRNGSRPSQRRPAEYFTGDVRVDPLIQAPEPSRVIWCPPGKKHWHGASPTTGLTHIAVQEMLNGKNVDWLEKVTDEHYLAGPPRKEKE